MFSFHSQEKRLKQTKGLAEPRREIIIGLKKTKNEGWFDTPKGGEHGGLSSN